MRVILMQKIERLGEPGQQVEVADGYARNFLLPKRLAVPATPGHVKSLVQLKAQTKNREDRLKVEASALAERLATTQVTLNRRSSEEETPGPSAAVAAGQPSGEGQSTTGRGSKLFGSVTSQDVSDALAAQGLAVDRKKILLAEPIKTLGVHRVPVRLHPEVIAEVTVTVEREG